MHNILVSNVGFGKASPVALQRLREVATVRLNESGLRFDEQRFLDEIAEAEVLIAGTEKISAKVIANASKLKLIARVGVGVDNLDLPCLERHSISVCYTPQAPSQAIPEFSLALMLNLIKNHHAVDRAMHQGIWLKPMGSMLSSHHLGIVGAGQIGSAVIKMVKCVVPEIQISFYDPCVEQCHGAQHLSLDELVTQCSLISLHLPLNNTTKDLFDKNLMQKMRSDAYLINTSRGGIVDEKALFELLEQKKIVAAAVDVFEQEPYSGPLSMLDNCLLTSHIGSLTREVRQLMEEQVVEDIVRFLQGIPMLRALNGYEFTQENVL